MLNFLASQGSKKRREGAGGFLFGQEVPSQALQDRFGGSNPIGENREEVREVWLREAV